MEEDASIDDAIVPQRSNAPEIDGVMGEERIDALALQPAASCAQRVYSSAATLVACGSGLGVGRVVSLRNGYVWLSMAGAVYPVRCNAVRCSLGDTVEVLVHGALRSEAHLPPLDCTGVLLHALHMQICKRSCMRPYVPLDWEGTGAASIGCIRTYKKHVRLFLAVIGTSGNDGVVARDPCRCICKLRGISAPIGAEIIAFGLHVVDNELEAVADTVAEIIYTKTHSGKM